MSYNCCMPHLIVEYTDNIEQADISQFLQKLNQVLIDRSEIYPIGGIRARAVRLTEYLIADGANSGHATDATDSISKQDAFVHVALKIGAGRSAQVKQETGDALFSVVTEHFAEEFEKRPLALSLEIQEFAESGTWKKNGIHARYKKS